MLAVARPSRGAYRRFARYYDLIYHGLVNYEGDVDFLENVFQKFHIDPKTVLDLGCGTGNHDLPLARRGYRVTGIDRSREMLSLARKKGATLRPRPRFVHADMRSFRLGERFDVAICMFGAFGYLLTQRDALQSLRSIRTHLEPKGFFVFEFWHGPAARPSPFQTWTHIAKKGIEIVRLDEARFDPRTGRLPVEFRFFVFGVGRWLGGFDEIHTILTYPAPGTREWVAREKAGIGETLFRLHQEGLSAAAIGVRLRDGFGVPSVRLATGRSLLEILRSKGAKFALPEDLAGLIRRAASLQTHLKEH